MIFFRKKKEEEAVEEIKDIVEGRKVPEVIPQPPIEEKIPEVEKPVTVEEKPAPPVTEEPEKPVFAPLFVKIEKYRSVLNSINDLKTTVIMIKNAFSIQKQIDSLRNENRKFLELAIKKIDKKIVSLDMDFLRPQGYEEEFPPPIYEAGGLEGVVDDLKKQIEGLKSELQTIT